MKLNKTISLLLLSTSILFSPVINAWEIDKANSTVSFVSIKKGTIGEAHTLSDIDGSIVDNKTVTVNIRPDSVESGVPIRNERMREFLFKTSLYPSIKINADIETVLKNFTNQSDIKPIRTEISADVSLHGVNKTLILDVYINMTAQGSLVVSTAKPVIVRAKDFNLSEGILKLASLVNNLDIAQSVPVTFLLTFEESEPKHIHIHSHSSTK